MQFCTHLGHLDRRGGWIQLESCWQSTDLSRRSPGAPPGDAVVTCRANLCPCSPAQNAPPRP